MTPDHLLIASLVAVAIALVGVFIGRRYGQPAVIAVEQKAADVGEAFLARLLDDSADDRTIEQAQERKTARAAEGAKVLAKLQAKLQTASPAGLAVAPAAAVMTSTTVQPTPPAA